MGWTWYIGAIAIEPRVEDLEVIIKGFVHSNIERTGSWTHTLITFLRFPFFNSERNALVTRWTLTTLLVNVEPRSFLCFIQRVSLQLSLFKNFAGSVTVTVTVKPGAVATHIVSIPSGVRFKTPALLIRTSSPLPLRDWSTLLAASLMLSSDVTSI